MGISIGDRKPLRTGCNRACFLRGKHRSTGICSNGCERTLPVPRIPRKFTSSGWISRKPAREILTRHIPTFTWLIHSKLHSSSSCTPRAKSSRSTTCCLLTSKHTKTAHRHRHSSLHCKTHGSSYNTPHISHSCRYRPISSVMPSWRKMRLGFMTIPRRGTVSIYPDHPYTLTHVNFCFYTEHHTRRKGQNKERYCYVIYSRRTTILQ